MRTVPDLATIEQQVIGLVADALSRPVAEVKPYSSLMDDLGAESIDFMDIVFRLEGAFDTLIPQEEIWAGSIELAGDDPASVAKAVSQLRERTPEFHWERFPNGVSNSDLPRLITVNTVAAYLRKHLIDEAAKKK